MEHRVVEVDSFGIATSFLPSEAASPGLPLFLVHGWGGSRHTFRHLLPLASQTSLVIPDLPGWGDSDVPEAPYNLDFYANTLLGLLDAAGLDRVVYVGHGLGGSAGLALAARAPDRVERLVLASPGTWRNPYAGLRARLLEGLPNPMAARALSTRTVLEQLLSKHHHEPHGLDPAVVDRALRVLARPEGRRAAWLALRTDIDSGAPAHLPGVRCPLTLVWGLNDAINPLDLGRRLVEERPGTEIRLIPNCGHAIPEARPRSFATHLVRVLGLPLPEGIWDGHASPS